MNTFSKNFDDIIKSSNGQHISLYLKNDGSSSARRRLLCTF